MCVVLTAKFVLICVQKWKTPAGSLGIMEEMEIELGCPCLWGKEDLTVFSWKNEEEQVETHYSIQW